MRAALPNPPLRHRRHGEGRAEKGEPLPVVYSTPRVAVAGCRGGHLINEQIQELCLLQVCPQISQIHTDFSFYLRSSAPSADKNKDQVCEVHNPEKSRAEIWVCPSCQSQFWMGVKVTLFGGGTPQPKRMGTKAVGMPGGTFAGSRKLWSKVYLRVGGL